MRKKHIIFTVIFASASLLMFIGCTSVEEMNISSTEGAPVDTGYPPLIVIDNDAEGYPYPGFEPGIAPGFTPNPSLGIVHGKILHNNEPVVGYSVYLADLLVDQEGIERVASLKRSSSPQAVLDKDGIFVFNEVFPNRYALMFSDGVSSYLLLLPEADSEEAIIVDVIANEKIDLGILNYLDFPLD